MVNVIWVSDGMYTPAELLCINPQLKDYVLEQFSFIEDRWEFKVHYFWMVHIHGLYPVADVWHCW